jgi:large subunit ribosomal protein L30
LTEENKMHRRCIAAIRIRGTISASIDVRKTLQMLNLLRNNYAVLIDNRQSFLGMIRMVRDYVTYGEPSGATVTMLIKKRGRLLGNKKLTEEYAKKVGYESLDALADAIHSCRAEYWKLPDIRPVFRLHPPTKGFKGKIKKSYRAGGELGRRDAGIDKLLERML